jgi:hypothetical protein
VNVGVPQLSNFDIPEKTNGDFYFTINPPTTNSTGAFSYASSDTSVSEIIDGNKIRIIDAGTCLITATQAATNNFTEGTITAQFKVNQSSLENPTRLTDTTQFVFFMESTSNYATLNDSIEVGNEIQAFGGKVVSINNIFYIKDTPFEL